MNRDRRLSFELDSKLAELRVCKNQAPVDGSAKKTPFHVIIQTHLMKDDLMGLQVMLNPAHSYHLTQC